MVKPANSKAQRANPATQACAVCPSSLETTGDPRSANSAAPKGCVGQGMGSMPMSPAAQSVPAENATTASTSAQGIVTLLAPIQN